MRIAEFLSPESVVSPLKVQTKSDALKELGGWLSKRVPELPSERIVEVLAEREKLGSTGIGEGVAIPHGKVAGLKGLVACFAVCSEGVDFQAIDGKPSRLFFALLAPENSAGAHLKALARISRLFKNARFRDDILRAPSTQAIYALIAEEDSRA
jgi:PTS system nitrogen regulatory IIA component